MKGIIGGRVKVMNGGNNRYTMHYVIFDPKTNKVTGEDAKNLANAVMHISKARLKLEYDVIYAQAYKDFMGRAKVTMYKTCTKAFANCIFVVPTKHRKDARKVINEYFNHVL